MKYPKPKLSAVHRKRIERWVAYLRQYPERQLEGALGAFKYGQPEKNCCLGAACKLAKLKRVVTTYPSVQKGYLNVDYDNESRLPSFRLYEWLGLSDFTNEGGDLNLLLKNGRKVKASWLNDGLSPLPEPGEPLSYPVRKRTWPEIADIIEANFL